MPCFAGGHGLAALAREPLTRRPSSPRARHAEPLPRPAAQIAADSAAEMLGFSRGKLPPVPHPTTYDPYRAELNRQPQVATWDPKPQAVWREPMKWVPSPAAHSACSAGSGGAACSTAALASSADGC